MFLKLMGAMPSYIYAQDKTGIYVSLFVGSTARIPFAGQEVLLKQTTSYPWRGDVTITIEPAKASEFALHLRIPGWSQGRTTADDLYQQAAAASDGAARLDVNGKPIEHIELVRGYATLHRRWQPGDVVHLTLDMPVQRIKANPQVQADNNRVSFRRGPVVYCFEGADNGGAVQNLAIPPATEFTPEYRRDFLGGVTVLNATATGVFRTVAKQVVSMPVKVTAVPYYLNANRGASPMQVWMPEREDRTQPEKQE
jgi:DUF1680 family protein